jgi:hypothetical protein
MRIAYWFPLSANESGWIEFHYGIFQRLVDHIFTCSTNYRKQTTARGKHMQYMLLIYETEGRDRGSQEYQDLMREYMAFTAGIVKSGNFKAGDALEPTSSATTVQLRSGKTMVTDGPFAETKEQLGGYYLIDAKDLDEAIALAARIPAARTGSIEVRPVRNVPRPT